MKRPSIQPVNLKKSFIYLNNISHMKNIKYLFFASAMSLVLMAFAVSGPGYQIGDTATDFSLKNIDGKMVSLADFEEAKGFIITFTCNHCPIAKLYEDRIIDIHNKYAPMGYPVIAINPNDPVVQPEDSYEKMKERAEEKAFPFVYLLDEGQKIYPQYGAKVTPHIFLLDSERIVKYIGAIDDSPRNASKVEVKYLENAIMALENGEDPNPSFKKALGCSIKTQSKS